VNKLFTVLVSFVVLAASSLAEFLPVGLSSWPNWNNYFVDLPSGNTEFDSIPFYVRDYDPAFIVTADGLPGGPSNVVLPVSITSPTAIHLLINGGSMYNYLMGVQVGYLRFVGSSGLVDVPLVGGVNIREWSPAYPSLVINTLSDPKAREVWSGMWNGWTLVPARVDLYTIYLPPGLGTLESVEIYDTHGGASINVYGVTVETAPVPEPLTLGIVALGLVAAIKRRRK